MGTRKPIAATWLTEQEPELSTRLDLAKLLDTEGAGVATYTTDADTLANTQQMLGSELADRVGDISYDTKPEDLEELRKDLADSVAVASAAIAQIKTLLAARESG